MIVYKQHLNSLTQPYTSQITNLWRDYAPNKKYFKKWYDRLKVGTNITSKTLLLIVNQ